MDDRTHNLGHTDEADPIGKIGEAMARMRIMVGRRYIGRLAIARAGAGMELSHLDVLGLVNRLSKTQEVTIGMVAEQMRLDHSRASRVVTELVKRGALRREASQQDARRTIVALTDQGAGMLRQLEEVKREVLGQVLADWPQEDVDNFARLFARFTRQMGEQAAAFDAETEAD